LEDNQRQTFTVSHRFGLVDSVDRSSVGGRPTAGQRRRVAARWQPYAGRGPTRQVTKPSRPPQRRSLPHSRHTSLSLPFSPPPGGTTERSSRLHSGELVHAHHCPQKLTHRSALKPPPSSTSQLGQLWGGKAALPCLPPSASDIPRQSAPVAWPCSSGALPSSFLGALGPSGVADAHGTGHLG
jgi:hypothetical protein